MPSQKNNDKKTKPKQTMQIVSVKSLILLHMYQPLCSAKSGVHYLPLPLYLEFIRI